MASRNACKYADDGRFDDKRSSQFPAFERAILNYATQCLDEWRDKAIETANSLVSVNSQAYSCINWHLAVGSVPWKAKAAVLICQALALSAVHSFGRWTWSRIMSPQPSSGTPSRSASSTFSSWRTCRRSWTVRIRCKHAPLLSHIPEQPAGSCICMLAWALRLVTISQSFRASEGMVAGGGMRPADEDDESEDDDGDDEDDDDDDKDSETSSNAKPAPRQMSSLQPQRPAATMPPKAAGDDDFKMGCVPGAALWECHLTPHEVPAKCSSAPA